MQLNILANSPLTINNFRVETFNITTSGVLESFFVQGGTRYISVNLISGTSITFSSISLGQVTPSSQYVAVYIILSPCAYQFHLLAADQSPRLVHL